MAREVKKLTRPIIIEDNVISTLVVLRIVVTGSLITFYYSGTPPKYFPLYV